MSESAPSARDLRELLDKQSIAELVLTYSRAVDRQDFGLLRSLYASDGVDDHGALYSGDAAGYVDWLESAMQGNDITAHGVQNHLIALTGESTAEGEVYVTAYHRIRGGATGFGEIVGGYRYLDHYRKEDGCWRFARRQLVVDWHREGAIHWDPGYSWLRGSSIGEATMNDASYRLSHKCFARSKRQ